MGIPQGTPEARKKVVNPPAARRIRALSRVLTVALSLCLLVGCGKNTDIYRESDTIAYDDYLFIQGEIKIPYIAEVAGGTLTTFRTPDDLAAVRSKLDSLEDPKVTTRDAGNGCLLLTVDVGEKGSNAILYEITSGSGEKDQHYYNLHGLIIPVKMKNSALFVYWPYHLMDDAGRKNRLLGLQTGQIVSNYGSFEQFAAFYDEVSAQYGLPYTKTDDQIILPAGWFYPAQPDMDVRVVFTFTEVDMTVDVCL